jgi:SAM-dependent methyltransferase
MVHKLNYNILMPLDWMNVSDLSFNSLLLLERIQLSWFPGWLPEDEIGIALQGNPAVEWYLRNKCPVITSWVDRVMADAPLEPATPERLRQAELKVMNSIMDLLVYVVDPAIYDAQPFLGWDSNELISLVDFSGKTVIDVGSGTGRLAFIAAPSALVVFAVEPIANLRHYLLDKAREQGFTNVYPTDGLITDIPFPDHFADITLCGHVFGDQPLEEYGEMKRVTKKGGMLVLCPGSSLGEENNHQFLVDQGLAWSQYEEPRDGIKRKYWKTVD